jgi:hypothetical protein
MTRKAIGILPACWIVIFFLAVPVSGGDVRQQIYNGIAPDGGVQDRCLNTEIPVYIKKVSDGLYFVRVRSRFTGQVRAGSYGEARNIGCREKTDVILYGADE